MCNGFEKNIKYGKEIQRENNPKAHIVKFVTCFTIIFYATVFRVVYILGRNRSLMVHENLLSTL